MAGKLDDFWQEIGSIDFGRLIMAIAVVLFLAMAASTKDTVVVVVARGTI